MSPSVPGSRCSLRSRSASLWPPLVGDERSPTSGGAGAGRAFDQCLVGNWKQTQWQADVDVGALTGHAAPGTVHVSGEGRDWTIFPSGRSLESIIGAFYYGTSADGRAVKLRYGGSITWTLTTTDKKTLSITNGDGAIDLTISIDNTEVYNGKLPLDNRDNIPYTCHASTWQITGPHPNDAARYTRL